MSRSLEDMGWRRVGDGWWLDKQEERMGSVKKTGDGEDFVAKAVSVAIVLVIIFLVAIYVPSQTTVEHDGHRWVKTTRGGIVHHPDCPCRAERDGER